MSARKRTAAALIAVTLLTAGCGRLNDDAGAGGQDDTIPHPTGEDQLVLRIATGGGFVPIEYTWSVLPEISIYGDGRMMVQGPMIEIFPGPALPNLLVLQLSETQVQAILAAAKEAGLMGGDRSYGYDCVADAPTTTFTVVADGSTSVVSAYALGFDEGGGCPGVDSQARAALSRFRASLGDLTAPEPGEPPGQETPYVPDRMRVFVQPYRGEPELPQAPVQWPVGGPMDAFGQPVDGPEEVRCGVVTGEDLASLLEAAASANQLTPWTDGEVERQLILRPLLPDENGC